MQALEADEHLCGARTRSGALCHRPKMRGRSRCRLHGGAPGSGAPAGKRNGRYTEGEHTKVAKAEQRWVRRIVAVAEGKTDMNDVAVPANQGALIPAPPGRRARPVQAKVRQVEGSIRRIAEPIHLAPAEWASALREALGTTSDHF